MTHNAVGGISAQAELAADWHRCLSGAQLAAYLRYQYIRRFSREDDWTAPAHGKRRPQWDGGADNYGVRHTAVWQRVAGLVREHSAAPGVWVAAHFSGVGYAKEVAQTHTVPEVRPNRLCSDLSYGTYVEYRQHLPKILEKQLDVAGLTLVNRLRSTQAFNLAPDDHYFYVLCDEGYVSASPLFRYAFAVRLQCDRAIQRYLWSAAVEYESQQDMYDGLGEDWFADAQLRNVVTQIREHWSGAA